jgi:hypothetical protein
MSDPEWLGFLVALTIASGFFFFKNRRFDLVTVAYIGAAFYFSPMIFGSVIVPSGFDASIPSQAYWIASSYLMALIAAGSIAPLLPSPVQNMRMLPPIAACCLLLSVVGFVCAIAASRGEIFNSDKVVTLGHVGYWFVLFEISASLACIAGVLEGNWRATTAACMLLVVDLLFGFRACTVLTAISVAFVLLGQQPEMRLYRKIPSYGVAAIVLVAAMLLVHTARSAIFDHRATTSDFVNTTTMRGDTLQYIEAKPKAGSTRPNWPQIPLHLFKQSEPFVTQSILSETIHSGYSCSATNIFKSLTLIPGAAGLLSVYPMTFFEEFQPVLFPNTSGGLGGNIWAEMLCRFGYTGVAVFGTVMIAALIGLHRLFLYAPSTLRAPLAFCGLILAFYIHRNDLHYTLVMMRQAIGVSIIALLISLVASARPWPSIRQTRKPDAVI